MTNAIDNKIQSAIEQQAGYSLKVFRTRFNDGARGAVSVFNSVFSEYNQYMTEDYCKVVLSLIGWRVRVAIDMRKNGIDKECNVSLFPVLRVPFVDEGAQKRVVV